MILNSDYNRSFKGFLLHNFMDFKKTLIIGSSIVAGTILIDYIFAIILLNTSLGNSTDSVSSGAMIVGYGIMVVTLIIATFVNIGNTEVFSKFVFPIDRKIFATGSFLMNILGSMILMFVVCMASLIELLLSKLCDMVSLNYFLFFMIDTKSFLVGFWVGLCYMVFAVSFVYMLSMVFHRFKLITTISLGILFALSLFTPFGSVIAKSFTFIFSEASVTILSLKLWGFSIIFNLIGFIPLNRMEVVK